MADSTVKKEILLPSERKMSRKERLDYTWHDMKRNYMCYLMLLPFMLLFLVFTVIPVIMSLPMGFTDFDMASAPKFVGLQNFYTLFLADDVFIHQNYPHFRHLYRTSQLCDELPACMAHK